MQRGLKSNIVRRSLALVAALAFFGLGYATRMFTSKTRAASATITTRVITVTTANATQTISASGTIEPTTQDNLNFSIQGTVNQVNVSAGQTVKAGQALATLVTAPLAASVAQAQASLAGIEAKLASDQSSGASSAQINADQANITAATDSLASAQSSLADATLTSPVSGVISAVNIAPGSVTSQNGATSPAFTLISSGSWTVIAGVADADISKIQVGEQVSMVPQGTTDVGYGTVSSVGLVATSSGGVATFPVSVAVTGSPTGFYAGVPAQVTVTTRVVANATVIPILAVYGLGTKPYVKLVTASGVKNHPVSLGTVSGANVTVIAGVRPGDRIQERVPRFVGLAAGRGAARGFGGGGLGG